jgi:hypothetical protein
MAALMVAATPSAANARTIREARRRRRRRVIAATTIAAATS